MSQSVQDRELAWKRSGKGNGLRWLMLRDVVAGVSLHPMTLEKVQDYLLMLRGVSWNTSRTMLTELDRMGAVTLYLEPPGMWMYKGTEKGVIIFLKHRRNIPARLARAVSTTMNVSVDAVPGGSAARDA